MTIYNMDNAQDLGGIDLFVNNLYTGVTTTGQVTASNIPGTLVTNVTGTNLGPSNGSDDTNTIQTALNTVATTGGGTVFLGPYRYIISSANLTIPTNVVLSGRGDPLYNANNTLNYTSQVFCLVVSPSRTISMNAGSSLKNLSIQSSVLFTPGSIRDNINMVNSFAGTAITINGSETLLENIFCIGFNILVSSSGFPRININKFYGDGNSGLVINGCHDISKFHGIHLWPFVTANSIYTSFAPLISNATDNGSGAYRITVPSQSTIVTGDTVYVAGIVGAQGANGKFTATVISPTSIDLVGSLTSPTFVANSSSGSSILTGVTTFTNLAQGQTLSGTGITANTTIKGIWSSKNSVLMSSTATSTATATTITVTNSAYTSGGSCALLTGLRPGTGFTVTNSEVNVFVDCFALGYSTGFHIGTSAAWETFIGCQVDSIVPPGVPQNPMVGVLIDGSSKGTQWIGGSMQAVGTSIVCNSTSSEAHIFSGVDLNSASLGNGISLDHQQGALILSGCVSGVATNTLIADSINTLTIGSSTMGNWVIYTQSATGAAKVRLNGTNFLGSGSANLVYRSALPTADPHVLNQWWANSSVVTISAG